MYLYYNAYICYRNDDYFNLMFFKNLPETLVC